MRKHSIYLTLLFSAFLFMLSACLGILNEEIRGNGELQTKTEELGPFHSLTVAGTFNTIYTVGLQYKVEIIAESNLMEHIEVIIEEGVLKVKESEDVDLKPTQDIEINIQGPPLNSAALIQSGSLNLGSMTNDAAMNISLVGSGRIYGDVNLPNVGLSMTGSGEIEISGTVVGYQAEITGSGVIDTRALNAAGADATIKGSGTIYTGATDKLKASVMGSGNIFYKGDPQLEASVNGSGKIEKKGS